MLCDLVSLLTNRTRDPWLTVTCVGLTPADVIVMVADDVPVEGPSGTVLPPQADSERRAVQRRTRRTAPLSTPKAQLPTPQGAC